VLRTAEAASPIAPAMLMTTLAMYLVVYVILLGAYISVLLLLARKAAVIAEAEPVGGRVMPRGVVSPAE